MNGSDRNETPPRIRFGALTIVSTRPRVLARFYSKLLSWPYVREEQPAEGEPEHAGFAITCPPEGVHEPALLFEYGRDHRRPVWPTIRGEQTPTMHLDLGVDNLEEGVAWAIECGATIAELQPAPAEHRVLIDPEGHPFCLCLP